MIGLIVHVTKKSRCQNQQGWRKSNYIKKFDCIYEFEEKTLIFKTVKLFKFQTSNKISFELSTS